MIDDDTDVQELSFTPAVPSEDGGHVQASEARSVCGPRIRLRVSAPIDLTRPDGPAYDVPILLTTKNAWLLAGQLRVLVRNHYLYGPLPHPSTVPDRGLRRAIGKADAALEDVAYDRDALLIRVSARWGLYAITIETPQGGLWRWVTVRPGYGRAHNFATLLSSLTGIPLEGDTELDVDDNDPFGPDDII